MLTAYKEWIDAYVAERVQLVTPRLWPPMERTLDVLEPACVRGDCWDATRRMAEAFPELRRVRGYYDNAPHWWLATADGEVIDPTAKQFAPATGVYREYTGPDPLGKCMNCGNYVWTSEFSGQCSAECFAEIKAAYS